VRFIGILGLIVLMGIGLLFSTNRRKIPFRVIIWGVALQFLLVVIILGSRDLSWAGMSVFLFLLLSYIYQHRLVGTRAGGKWIAPIGAIVLAGIAAVALGLGLARIGMLPYVLLAVLIALVVGMSLQRRTINRAASAALLAGAFAWIISAGASGQDLFQVLSNQVDKFLKLTDLGTEFLFGNLVKQEYFYPNATTWPGFGYQFAFAVLPTIIFFSAFMSILYHMGIMQFLVELMAKFMRWTLGTSGTETLSCSANIFVGQTEAPLLIRPFLDDMTKSELHAVMVGGFATIAGGVLAGYIRMGIDPGYLIAASVMSAPAALVMAKIIMPEVQVSKTAGEVRISREKQASNLLDAASRGVTDGLKLAANVGAMLIAFIALIGLIDIALAFGDKMIDGRLLGHALNAAKAEYPGIFPGSLKTLFGSILGPLAFVMGVPWKDAANVGNLMGIKVSANEFVAYGQLSMELAAHTLSTKAQVIATYALCGFANFASIGIQIGGIGALAPGRRSDLANVALRAMAGGALASWMTASIAGMFVS
jgi:CNT family concentrative nucleoside transporter